MKVYHKSETHTWETPLNFFNEFSSSTSQFMVIDSDYKFEIDDFNIYIVFELNKLIPGAASFLFHSPPNGYSGNSYITITFNNARLNTHIGYTNPSNVFSTSTEEGGIRPNMSNELLISIN